MKIKYNKTKLTAWLLKAYATNMMYFRSRRILFDDLIGCIDVNSNYIPDPQLLNTIRSSLIVRNDWLDDNKLLALMTAIETLIAEMDDGHVIRPSAHGRDAEEH